MRTSNFVNKIIKNLLLLLAAALLFAGAPLNE